MSRNYLPPIREEPDEVAKLSIEEVDVKSYVGGLVKASIEECGGEIWTVERA